MLRSRFSQPSFAECKQRPSLGERRRSVQSAAELRLRGCAIIMKEGNCTQIGVSFHIRGIEFEHCLKQLGRRRLIICLERRLRALQIGSKLPRCGRGLRARLAR